MSCNLPHGQRCLGGFHSRAQSRAESLAHFYSFHDITRPSEEDKASAANFADRYAGRDIIFERCPRAIMERAKRKMRAMQGANR